MNRHLPFAAIIARRRQSTFDRIRELVIVLAIVALPALSVLAMAREVRIAHVLTGGAVTLAGQTSAGNRISLTTYAALPLDVMNPR